MTSDNDPISSPCQSSRNRAFLTLDGTPPAEIERARATCRTCPLLRGCALDALHAGTVLDESWQRPAADVVQAGVICRGDADTATALAEVARVEVPEYQDKFTRRMIREGDTCRNCHRPLVSWTRDPEEVPEGYVMHHGRQHCVNCRTQYRRLIATEGRVAIGLRKQIDRHRSHRNGTPLLTAMPEPAPEPERTAEELEALEFMLRLWKPGSPRPPRCLDCRRPLRDSNGPVIKGRIRYAGNGLCSACYKRHAPFLRRMRAEAKEKAPAAG